MSNEQTQLEVVAAAWSPAEVKARIDANKEIVGDFPEGMAPFVNNSLLKGYPFLIVSQWREAHVEDKTFPSGKQYPAHQVMQVMVRTINPSTYAVYDPELATLSGEYLLNQFRNATPNEFLLGGPWTIRENPNFVTKRGTHPDMLARYRPEVDDVPVEPSVFDDDTLQQATKRAEAASFNLLGELAQRNLSEDEFVRYTGWSTVRGHSTEQYRIALELIDRTRKLGEVTSLDSVDKVLRDSTGEPLQREQRRPHR